jgi:Fe-S cluster biogenesis protein NfuA
MSDLRERIENSLIDLRSFVKQDGGDLEIVEVTDEGVVKVELKGACTSCHMNNMTFKAGVEDAILKAVPEVKRVEAINFDLFGV